MTTLTAHQVSTAAHADRDEYPERDGDVCTPHLVRIISGATGAVFYRCEVCRREIR